jgi:hypothetical protein
VGTITVASALAGRPWFGMLLTNGSVSSSSSICLGPRDVAADPQKRQPLFIVNPRDKLGHPSLAKRIVFWTVPFIVGNQQTASDEATDTNVVWFIGWAF